MSVAGPIVSLAHSVRDDSDALIDLVRRLAEQNDALREHNDALTEEIKRLNQRQAELEQELAKAEREGKRQAAPFRIADEKRKENPKKPGRPKGHKGTYRPRPEHVDQTIEVELPACPLCHRPVQNVKKREQFIEEIPPVRPYVTRLVTYEGQCPHCGPVQTTHPLQVSTATGAAGTHLGPRALGVAVQLAQKHGLPKRETCDVLHQLFGLKLSPGGLVHAAHRMAGKLGSAFEKLQRATREADAIYVDETSWWVGEPGWYLLVFTQPSYTLYQVRPSRARQEIYDTLGTDFPGVLISDCLAIYDDVCLVQQKCYAHHAKAISEAMKQYGGTDSQFLRCLKCLLEAARLVKDARSDLSAPQWREARNRLDRMADHLLANPRADPVEEAVANRFRKQRDHLFTFLDYPGVDATNNAAERQLRPAVIARKLSCGNRTPRGARTWEILASLAATCAQTGTSFLEMVANAAPLHPNPLPAR